MRIVIDGRLWSESGLGRYVRNLVFGLQEIDKVNEYYILLLKKDYNSMVCHTNNFHKVLADFRWYEWEEQVRLFKLLRELKGDLVHFPHFNIPIFYRGKFIVTIHDLIHQHFQTRQTTTLNPIFYTVKKIGYRKAFSTAVKNSVKVITPSNFVKKQLVEEWGVREGKVVVTPEGVDLEVVRKVMGVGEKDFVKVAEKFKLKKPYLFYVGNAQPHKNLVRLVRVFGKLKEKFPGLSLVLSGPDSLFWERVREESSHFAKASWDKGVVFTGFLKEEEMVVLYKNAEAFVMPSLEEGFGIPILEAMACGCPVISSSAGSLSEVGGDAVVYFNPEDEEDMVKAIEGILGDEGLREKMIKQGFSQVKKFSWEKMARETLEIYQNA